MSDTRLVHHYQNTVVPELKKELKRTSAFAVPRLTKIVVNTGVADPQEPRARQTVLENIAAQFSQITGQKAQITVAKKSIANFKLREGDPLGVRVTLHGQRMWEFVEKLISVALPRVKDFRGVSRTAFDGQGNYSLGLEEQIVFPEIDYDTIESVRSLQITFVTTAETNEEAFLLLEKLGMPFAKEE